MSKGHDKHLKRVGLISLLGKDLARRSGACCELCLECGVALQPFEIPPLSETPELDRTLFLCAVCRGNIEKPKRMDILHWRCLSKSVWSEVPAVQVMAVRILSYLKDEPWAGELLDQVYLEPDLQDWINAAGLDG
ncbi:hypothetical protein OLMES_0621 [Oleiphilus messinensis]|uniref:PhnA protein n=1 Tax=Oleiphilus messinensis TaxID=141451 RepID=A0A1Y0I5K0_9GAMM|nr:hypothetical protein [Oleiphilus messinensis]ARU54724.1 hypothetical protein OLMES_0621 [Oleiphilus messinensis]